jgi:hypothetical protein
MAWIITLLQKHCANERKRFSALTGIKRAEKRRKKKRKKEEKRKKKEKTAIRL